MNNIKVVWVQITQKKRLPVKLVYFEEFERIDHAFYREKQIQGWTRSKKIALIKKMDNDLHELSKCKNETNSENFLGPNITDPSRKMVD